MGKPVLAAAGLPPDQFEKMLADAIKKALKEGVREGIKEGRKLERAIAEEERKLNFNSYKETEKRLYALPDLKKKVASDKGILADIKKRGSLGRRSVDVVRFQRSGRRISEEEILEGYIQDQEANIARDVYEIKTIERVLKHIENDYYYPAIEARYFKNIKDDKKIAVDLHCDASTVRRHRSDLVKRLAVLLYGAAAVG